MPPATPQPAAEGGGAAIAAIGLVVGLLVIIGVVVKVFDLKQKRESEAVQLQAQLSDALLREPSLAGLPLTPSSLTGVSLYLRVSVDRTAVLRHSEDPSI